MRGYIRNTKQELEALGFAWSAEHSDFGKDAYIHPYEPDTPLKLWHQASQQACLAVVRRAYEIVGMANQGPKLPTTIKERAQQQRANEQLARLRRETESQRRVNNVLQLEGEELRRQELITVSKNLMGAKKPRCF
ncbi:MAG: hypothetical protein E6Q97_25255 [Desulfurellales bacterium]|nr:MAG: hypothetical protein E6Q97_25255 [Desulfurellales bacterium]